MNNNNLFWQNNYGNMKSNMPQQSQPQMFYQQNPQEMFIIRFVGSREEAVATPGDYFRPTLMLGLNHGMIYIKAVNNETGSMDFKPFKYSPDMAMEPEYLTVGEFQNFKGQVLEVLETIKSERRQEVADV